MLTTEHIRHNDKTKGRYGCEAINENAKVLLRYLHINDLFIGSTSFPHHEIRYMTQCKWTNTVLLVESAFEWASRRVKTNVARSNQIDVVEKGCDTTEKATDLLRCHHQITVLYVLAKMSGGQFTFINNGDIYICARLKNTRLNKGLKLCMWSKPHWDCS